MPNNDKPNDVAPSEQQLLNASNVAYFREGTVPPDMTPLYDKKGQPVSIEHVGPGFCATAFVTNDHKVIVGFQGTTLTEGKLSAGQGIADAKLAQGELPPAMSKDVPKFMERVREAAEALKPPIGRDGIYVTGHSLGGAMAAYAFKEGLAKGGASFGGPGVPQYTNPNPGAKNSPFTSYIDYGDQIAQHGTDTRIGKYMYPDSKDQDHVGSIKYIGDREAEQALRDAARNAGYGPGPHQAPFSSWDALANRVWGAAKTTYAESDSIGNHLLSSYANKIGSGAYTPVEIPPGSVIDYNRQHAPKLVADPSGNTSSSPAFSPTMDDRASFPGQQDPNRPGVHPVGASPFEIPSSPNKSTANFPAGAVPENMGQIHKSRFRGVEITGPGAPDGKERPEISHEERRKAREDRLGSRDAAAEERRKATETSAAQDSPGAKDQPAKDPSYATDSGRNRGGGGR